MWEILKYLKATNIFSCTRTVFIIFYEKRFPAIIEDNKGSVKYTQDKGNWKKKTKIQNNKYNIQKYKYNMNLCGCRLPITYSFLY